MRIAFGLKAHSGWAALVVISCDGNSLHVLDRRRIELVEDAGAEWAGHPYHAAEGSPPALAREIVHDAVEIAQRHAAIQLSTVIKCMREAGHQIAACAVLVPAPMPDWSVEQIIAVHMRMHKAEGVLFPDALCLAAAMCGLNLVRVPEKQLVEHAENVLSTPLGTITHKIASLGKSIGPPWGRDQKNATRAALIALQ